MYREIRFKITLALCKIIKPTSELKFGDQCNFKERRRYYSASLHVFLVSPQNIKMLLSQYWTHFITISIKSLYVQNWSDHISVSSFYAQH